MIARISPKQMRNEFIFLIAAIFSLVSSIDILSTVPSGKVLYGIQTDTSADPKNIKGYADAVNRYGEDLGSYGFFVDGGEGNLDQDIINQAKSVTNKDTIIVVSLHLISGGWESFTDDQVNKLISALSTVNQGGQRVMLRFMHEMNGGWYQYGQQPEKYVSYFKRVADLVHQKAPLTGMMWSPNHVDPNSADTVFDQYWPGDQYVDCVGLSLYYRGDEGAKVSKPTPDNFIMDNMKAGGFLDKYVTGKKMPFWLVESGFATYYQENLSDDKTISLLSTFVEQIKHVIEQLGDVFKGWTYFDLDKISENRKFSITNILSKPIGTFESSRSYLAMAKELQPVGTASKHSESGHVQIHHNKQPHNRRTHHKKLQRNRRMRHKKHHHHRCRKHHRGLHKHH